MRSKGAVIENLSGRKLSALVLTLLVCQVLCFLIGALVAPAPSSVETVLATKCIDRNLNSTSMMYVRGKNRCTTFDMLQQEFSALTVSTEDYMQLANHIVFAFQLPSPKDNTILDYSCWQQNLIGILQFDISFHSNFEMKPDLIITMNATLGYRDRNSSENSWKVYSYSVVERTLSCSVVVKKPGYLYNCSLVPLFELGSLFHDFYLLNIRIPTSHNNKRINTDVGRIEDMWLITINQNGGFTKVWISLKCIFFPCITIVMIWFWNRIRQLERQPVLLEYMLLILGITLLFLNIPVEFLSLFYDTPFMPLIQDVRQGIFYAALLSFWLIFAGEHLTIQDHRSYYLKPYWKHLSAVVVGCTSLFVYDLCEKGAQISNPFYSIWASKFGSNFALTFIICAGLSATVYFIFLCFMILRVFYNISVKKISLPNMSNIRRLHYEGIIYRFNFLMLTTIICAALTIVGFVMGQISEGHWKWDDHVQIEYMSGFFTGVYGMWNIYIFALIVLYAPSRKHCPQINLNTSFSDEMELNYFRNEPNEISSLTSFSKKTAND